MTKRRSTIRKSFAVFDLKISMPADRDFLLAFVIGALVRLLFLDSKCLWHDEALSLVVADAGPLAWVRLQFGAPLFFAGLAGWIKIGTADFWVRLFPFLGGLAALLVALKLVRTLFPGPGRLLALLMVALTPFPVEYSQEVRAYSWLTAFELAAMLALWRGMTRPSGRWQSAFAAALAAAALVHPAVWIWWAALVPGLILFRTGRRIAARFAASSVPAAVITLAGVLAALPVWRERLTESFRVPPVGEFLRQSVLLFSAGHHSGPLVAPWLVWFVPVLAAWGAAVLWNDRRREAAVFLVSLVVLPVAVIYLGIVAGVSTQLRYVAAVPFPLTFLLWAGLPALPRVPRAVAAVLMLAATADGFAGWHIRPPTLEPTFCLLSKKPLRQVAALIVAQWKTGDRVAHLSTASYLPMKWMAPGLDQSYLIRNPDLTGTVAGTLTGLPTPLTGLLGGTRRLWLVSCPWRFADSPVVPEEFAAILNARCGIPRLWSFPGVDVYLVTVRSGK